MRTFFAPYHQTLSSAYLCPHDRQTKTQRHRDSEHAHDQPSSLPPHHIPALCGSKLPPFHLSLPTARCPSLRPIHSLSLGTSSVGSPSPSTSPLPLRLSGPSRARSRSPDAGRVSSCNTPAPRLQHVTLLQRERARNGSAAATRGNNGNCCNTGTRRARHPRCS